MRTIFRDADGRALMVLDDPTPTDALVAARAAAGQGLAVETQKESAVEFLRVKPRTSAELARHLGLKQAHHVIAKLRGLGYGFNVWRLPRGAVGRRVRAYHLVRDPA